MKKSDQKMDQTASDDSDQEVHENKNVKKVGHKHLLLVIILHSETSFNVIKKNHAYLYGCTGHDFSWPIPIAFFKKKTKKTSKWADTSC